MTAPRRRGLRVGAAFAAGALALAALALWPPSPPERVILIVVDTLRSDHLSPYGARRPTPHLEALAERGQVFTNAVASFHQTSMSMGSLFTGRTPSIESEDPSAPVSWNSASWCGMARFAGPDDDGACIPAGLPTLAERLGEAGYWTIGVASNHFLFEPSGFGRGFSDWVEVGHPRGRAARADFAQLRAARSWAAVNRAAVEALTRRPTDRFFLYVHYMDTHDYLRHLTGDGYDVEATARAYAEAVARVDAAVGRLLSYLDREGLLDDTTVVLTADHGERLAEQHPVAIGRGKPFGHLGNPSYDELLRVPLIVAPAPAGDPAALVRTQDLFELIQEIAGARPEAVSRAPPEEVFLGELHFRTYRAGRWKSSLRRSDGSFHLFDLEGDPHETRDVADAHPDVVAAHRRRIAALSGELATRRPVRRELSAGDRERLRALGYLEE